MPQQQQQPQCADNSGRFEEADRLPLDFTVLLCRICLCRSSTIRRGCLGYVSRGAYTPDDGAVTALQQLPHGYAGIGTPSELRTRTISLMRNDRARFSASPPGGLRADSPDEGKTSGVQATTPPLLFCEATLPAVGKWWGRQTDIKPGGAAMLNGHRTRIGAAARVYGPTPPLACSDHAECEAAGGEGG